MQSKFFRYLLPAVSALALAGCMEFDSPADEFAKDEQEVDPVVYSGDADALDYRHLPPEDSLDLAIEALTDNFDQLYNAQLYLLGGKNGGMPAEHQYQYCYNLTVDNFAGYTTATQSWGGKMLSTYSYNNGFWEGPYGRFLSIKGLLGNLLNRDEANNIVELKAMALLVFDYAAQEMTDLYGSIPYVDHKSNKETNPFEFNKGADIYVSIIKNLDDIVAVFEHYAERPDWYRAKVDPVFSYNDGLSIDKTVDSWRRFANSLKLRMAMRLVKVMPDDARRWAEEAVASGVIEDRMQQMVLCKLTDFQNSHPLYAIQEYWNDTRANASFVAMLTQLHHPYINYMLAANSHDLINEATGEVLPANSSVIGLRSGIQMANGQSYQVNPRVAFSKFTGRDFEYMPCYAMKWAEVDFLRAEGALRGWNMGGEAAMFYERGIRNADCGDVFVEPTGNYDSLVEQYLKVAAADPYSYVDPTDSANDIDSRLSVGVAWNEGDDRETKLEKIITQKYIALFPYSYEAWSELRRTGYPRIFPVLNPQLGDGSLSYGDLIRRMPLPWGNIEAGRQDINVSGLPALGGDDLMSTRVFWDTDAPNF